MGLSSVSHSQLAALTSFLFCFALLTVVRGRAICAFIGQCHGTRHVICHARRDKAQKKSDTSLFVGTSHGITDTASVVGNYYTIHGVKKSIAAPSPFLLLMAYASQTDIV